MVDRARGRERRGRRPRHRRTPGCCWASLTADCVPVLLRSRTGRAIAAVHAGWRGASAGVLGGGRRSGSTALGAAPATLEAVIGPAIGPCCYVVGGEVRDAFRARSGDVTAAAWSARDGRLVLDLRAAATALLRAAGVADVTAVGPCTRCDPAWCSYRRDGAASGSSAELHRLGIAAGDAATPSPRSNSAGFFDVGAEHLRHRPALPAIHESVVERHADGHHRARRRPVPPRRPGGPARRRPRRRAASG